MDTFLRSKLSSKEVRKAVEDADCHLLVIGRRPPVSLTDRLVVVNAATIISDALSNILVGPRDEKMWHKRILLCYDVNRSASASVDIATTLAKATKVPVTLLAINTEGDAVLMKNFEEAVFLMRAEGVEAEMRVEQDKHPAEKILDVVREGGADLLVIGQPHGGLKRLLPYSVGDHLIGKSEWPILKSKSLK